MESTAPTTPQPLVVIPCGAAKLDHAAPAAELYTSSTFRLALDAARSLVRPYGAGDGAIRILSAKHGLLELDTVVEPYEVKMGDPGSIDPEVIGAQLDAQGLADHPAPVLLLPASYRDAIEAAGRFGDRAIDAYVGSEGVGDHRGRSAGAVRTEARRAEVLAR